MARRTNSLFWIIGGLALAVVSLFCGGAGLVGYWIYRSVTAELVQVQTQKSAPVVEEDPMPVGPGEEGQPIKFFLLPQEDLPAGAMKPAKPPPPPPLKLPPRPAPVPIKPAPLTQAVSFQLADTVDDLEIGGDGRFLILHFPRRHQLDVFDVCEIKVTHSFSAPEDRSRFAAGMTKLLVYAPGSGIWQRFDLLTGQREKIGKVEGVSGELQEFCMGSASAGPLLFATHHQQQTEARLLDIDTFQAQSIPGIEENPRMFVGVNCRASADGRLFTHSSGAIRLEDGKARLAPVRWMNFFVLPGPEGKYVYIGGHGVYTRDMQSTPDAVYSPPEGNGHCKNTYIPAAHGPYYMHVPVNADLPNRQPRDRNDPSYGVTLYQLGQRQPLAQLSNIGLFEPGNKLRPKGSRLQYHYERCLHLIPRAHVLVVLPPSGDKLILHPIDLEKKSEEAGRK